MSSESPARPAFDDPGLDTALQQALDRLACLAGGRRDTGKPLADHYRQAATRELARQIGSLAPADPWAPALRHCQAEAARLDQASRNLCRTLDLAGDSARARLAGCQDQLVGLEREGRRLAGERQAWYERQLSPLVGRLARTFRDDARQRQAAERRLEDRTGLSPGFWDLKPGRLAGIPWAELEATAAWLERFPELQELARRIGAGRPLPPPGPGGTGQPDEASRPVPARQGSLRTNAGWGELTGYTTGRDLDRLAGPDLARFLTPELADQILVEQAEGRLFLREYREYTRPRPRPQAPQAMTDKRPASQADRGPCILCVDTSGSMDGIPGLCAKALALALTRICLAEDRRLWLVLFSDRITSLELGPRNSDAGQDLLDFLAWSFRGGTDLRPALARSLELLATPGWTQADLLVVSDFRVPKIMIKRSAEISRIRQESAARIHALSVTAARPVDDLHLFDSSWHFALDQWGGPGGIDPGAFREVLG